MVELPKFEHIKKVIILGSGGIRIGQAAEFDYSGSQALKALKEEGIKTVLVNPNVATIQTCLEMADKVYLEPVTPDIVAKVIERERPDGILLGFGGQTALNVGVKLYEEGILEKYGVEVLGSSIETIRKSEDRDLFKKCMLGAGIPVPRSEAVYSIEEALRIAKDIGYPVIVRVAYALGGAGSGVAYNPEQLERIVRKGLKVSMTHQVLIEEYLEGWKEVEYEIVRDRKDNCIAVAALENFDPMGVHTGDSIVVAPTQTLTNREYHILRSAGIRAVKALGVVGECNIQFALNPHSERYVAIEVNPRMSRSSALASKATGYPLAYIAAKLAIGYTLPELINKVTGVTIADFEPALDYVVVKMPRWDFQKFHRVKRVVGTQMKSVGEAMAIGRCFEEALQKAIRSLEIGRAGLIDERYPCELADEELERALKNPTDERVFHITEAFVRGWSVDKVYELTRIDRWFLYRIKNIVDMWKLLKRVKPEKLDRKKLKALLREAKRLGFSDQQIAQAWKVTDDYVRRLRHKLGVLPVVKQIDTMAAEWPAKTNYLYVTYGGSEDDIKFSEKKKKVLVLGAGPNRIGSSVEFDWCTMNCVWGLKEEGVEEVIVLNCNPETVSTDYDMSDKLYFDEITLERVLDIVEKENPIGVVVSVGGQTPNNLALKLAMRGVKLLGTPAESIDNAEDRAKFSALLDKLGIPQPPWESFTSIREAEKFAEKVGYPVIVRPSYVLSGAAMRVARNSQELKKYLSYSARVSPEHPVVISKFLEGAKEVEVDGVSDGEEVYIGSVIEHIEPAGVHSGDSTMIIPPQFLPREVEEKIREYARRIALTLRIKGPFNIQFMVHNGTVYVIECNLRASRTMPFVSKVTGVNLIRLASKVMLGKKLREVLPSNFKSHGVVGVKMAMFSFRRLDGADPVPSVEMVSTGEVACIARSFYEALLKAFIATEQDIPKPPFTALLIVENDEGEKCAREILRELNGVCDKLYVMYKAGDHPTRNHLPASLCYLGECTPSNDDKDSEGDSKPPLIILSPNIEEVKHKIMRGEIKLIIDPLKPGCNSSHGYELRRVAVDMGVPLLTVKETAIHLLKAFKHVNREKLPVISLNDIYFH